jgi:tetraacyldisaccharide 4'-kinase
MFLDHQSIMSGHRAGPLSVLLRSALRLASVPYGWAVSIRNRRYDDGASEVLDCGVPVISVGNLTTGGTGKTPIVCLLATWFRQRGVRVAIVSRGYGRGKEDCNDEAMELHARLPDVPHVQDPDRVAAATIAVEELESQVILMDDGFQHRRLHRDLDIVVVDASCPFGYGHLLPRGLLREPLSGLQRADLVILTRCESVDGEQIADIESTIRRFNPSAALLQSDHRPTQLLEFPSQTTPIASLAGQQVAALSAIGNPAAFEETIQACGAKIVDTRRLPDHDAYSPSTVGELREWIRSLGDRVTRVVCTHKDLVKLKTDRIGGRPLAAVLIELEVTQGRSDLDSALQEIAATIPRDDS